MPVNILHSSCGPVALLVIKFYSSIQLFNVLAGKQAINYPVCGGVMEVWARVHFIGFITGQFQQQSPSMSMQEVPLTTSKVVSQLSLLRR